MPEPSEFIVSISKLVLPPGVNVNASCVPSGDQDGSAEKFAARFSRPDGGGSARHRMLYYLGVGVALWMAWGRPWRGRGVAGRGAARDAAPESAAPSSFLLLLLAVLAWAAYGSAVAGGIVAVAASGLPLRLGLLVGAAAGIAVGGALPGRHG